MLNAFSLLDETYTLNLAGNIDSRLKKILLDDRNDEKVKFFGQLPHDKLNDLFEKNLNRSHFVSKCRSVSPLICHKIIRIHGKSYSGNNA